MPPGTAPAASWSGGRETTGGGQDSRSVPAAAADDAKMAALCRFAGEQGVTAAAVIASSLVPVVDELAVLCRPPGCSNYGQSASCPPYVGGPDEMRRLLARFPRGLVLQIELPAAILFSAARDEVFRLLQELVAAVEIRARTWGCEARGFAGGCCRPLFCGVDSVCRVLAGDGTCRHPDRARPSLSGFGVDVNGLLAAAGMVSKTAGKPAAASLSSVCGLVLLS